MPDDYQTAFEYVRKTFFPRWDRKREWTLREVQDLDGAEGYCYRPRKQIEICSGYSGEKLLHIIIHEICHYSSHGHGKRWFLHMRRAASRAEALGKGNLFQALTNEIANYSDPARELSVSVKAVYGRIANWVWDSPDLRYDELIDYLRTDYGMTREEFHYNFKRSRKVYEQAKAEYEEEQQLRERFREAELLNKKHE